MTDPTPRDHTVASRPLVIAIGNPFRRDDGVGAAVVEHLRATGAVAYALDLLELDGEPTRLVDAWDGRPHVVVVDAVVDPRRAPGEVVAVRVREGGRPTGDAPAGGATGVSSHSAGIAVAVRLGEVLGRMPVALTVVGVVGGDFGDGPGLSPPVAAAIPAAADAVGSLVPLTPPRGRSRAER